MTVTAEKSASEVLFDLERVSPGTFEAAASVVPDLRVKMAELRSVSWIEHPAAWAGSVQAGIEGRAYRLPRHHRSCCVALDEQWPQEALGRHVLILKGTEPALVDFPWLVEWMASRPLRPESGHRAMLDAFPLTEGKVPGALTVHEALYEANIARVVQEAYLTRYRELPRIPLPLLVQRLPEAVTRRCTELLKARMLGRSFQRIEPYLKEGLAVVSCYYPGPPIRLDYYAEMASRIDKVPAFLRPAMKADLESAYDAWVRLFVRLLAIGYLPTTRYSDRLGSILDPGNVCIDGGACDIDSVFPIQKCHSKNFLVESVLVGVVALIVLAGCTLQVPVSEPETMVLLNLFVRGALDRILDEETAAQESLDPLVSRLLATNRMGDVSQMLALLRQARPAGYVG